MSMAIGNPLYTISIPVISSTDRTSWRTTQRIIGYKSGNVDLIALTNSAVETRWKIHQDTSTGIIFHYLILPTS
jgi:hypothetical protein